jgi:hypothetical protein
MPDKPVSFLCDLLDSSQSSPELVASTLFADMRATGYPLSVIKTTADYLKSHVEIDTIVNDL